MSPTEIITYYVMKTRKTVIFRVSQVGSCKQNKSAEKREDFCRC